jgi:hypothetical protein
MIVIVIILTNIADQEGGTRLVVQLFFRSFIFESVAIGLNFRLLPPVLPGLAALPSRDSAAFPTWLMPRAAVVQR